MEWFEYGAADVWVEEGQPMMNLANGAKIYGLAAIANYWFANGWEPVQLVPIEYRANGTIVRVVRFMLMLRRRLASPPVAPAPPFPAPVPTSGGFRPQE